MHQDVYVHNEISAICYRFVDNRLFVSPYSVVITVVFGFMYPWSGRPPASAGSVNLLLCFNLVYV